LPAGCPRPWRAMGPQLAIPNPPEGPGEDPRTLVSAHAAELAEHLTKSWHRPYAKPARTVYAFRRICRASATDVALSAASRVRHHLSVVACPNRQAVSTDGSSCPDLQPRSVCGWQPAAETMAPVAPEIGRSGLDDGHRLSPSSQRRVGARNLLGRCEGVTQRDLLKAARPREYPPLCATSPLLLRLVSAAHIRLICTTDACPAGDQG
jgi:hypothetical protein